MQRSYVCTSPDGVYESSNTSTHSNLSRQQRRHLSIRKHGGKEDQTHRYPLPCHKGTCGEWTGENTVCKERRKHSRYVHKEHKWTYL